MVRWLLGKPKPGVRWKERIFFFHIPKCAGMSVWHTIWDAVGHRNSFQVGVKEQRLEFEAMPYKSARSYRAIGGHGYLEIFTSRLQPMEDYLRVTVIRDPIDRIISEYNFIAGNEAHVRYHEVSRMSFEEFSEKGFHMQNMLTRLIAGTPNPDCAIGILETGFDAWYLTSEVNELNKLVCSNFGISFRRERHENQSNSKVRRNDIDAGLIRKLEQMNSADVELFERLKVQKRGGQLLQMESQV